jgi:hypothetical protein
MQLTQCLVPPEFQSDKYDHSAWDVRHEPQNRHEISRVHLGPELITSFVSDLRKWVGLIHKL